MLSALLCSVVVTLIWVYRYPATEVQPAQVLVSRNYSRAHCVGSVFVPKGREWQYRSCYFENACYDGNNQSRLILFTHPDDDLDDPATVSVATMVPYGRDPRAPVKEQAVFLRRGEQIPADARWPHGEQPVTVSLMNWFIPSVWSHLMMDGILPIFRLLDIFSLDNTVDIEPLMLEDPCPGQPGCGTSSKNYRPAFMDLLSPRHHWPLQPIRQKYPDGLVCFDRVIVGPSLFSDHMFGESDHGRVHSKPDWTNWGIGGTMVRFREFILRRAQVDHNLPDLYDVVFLTKGTLSWTNNKIDLSYISDNLDKTNLRVLQEVHMENMTLSDQMALAVQTKVIVAQEGSTAFGSLWMKPGSTLVMIGTSKLDVFFWNNLAHLHIRQFAPTQLQEAMRAIQAGLHRRGVSI